MICKKSLRFFFLVQANCKKSEAYFQKSADKELAKEKALKADWPEKIVSQAYNHRTLHIHKIVHIIYSILLKIESKRKTDYSLTVPDLMVSFFVSLIPIGFFLASIFLAVNIQNIIKVCMLWVLAAAVCLVATHVYYRITSIFELPPTIKSQR